MSIARIVQHKGLPKLEIDGKVTAPVFFFVNSDITAHRDISSLGIRYSKEADMHLYSVCCVLPVNPIYKTNGKRDFKSAYEALDLAIENDGEAKILIRINISIYGHAAAQWAKRYPGDLMEFMIDSDDGSQMVDENGDWVDCGSMVTITSEDWLREATQTLTEFLIEIGENPKYNEHVIGYHIAGAETGEWFHYQLREKGIDISGTNQKTYRKWLKEKYNDIGSLNMAWGGKSYNSFEEVALPMSIPGNDRSQRPEITLFTRDEDVEYIDYSKYSSEIMADRILALAKKAREIVGYDKLIVFFYGYYFDLYDSRTGHFFLKKVLESKDIDAISGPICYTDKNEGGVGAYMSPVETIHNHGKLWFVENDIRTFMVARKSPSFDWCKPVESLENLIQVYKREAGASLAHGTGCWYMDLFAVGWQAHPVIWNTIRTLKDLLQQRVSSISPIKPDIALLVDEEAMAVSAHAEGLGMNLLYKTRLELYRAGVKFGLYELSDFLEGKTDGIKLAILINPFEISEEKAKIIKNKLDEIGCSVLWMHGLGRTSKKAFNMVTGMDIEVIDDKMNSLEMEVSPAFLKTRDINLDATVNQFINNINITTLGDAGRGNEYQKSNPVYYVTNPEGPLAFYTNDKYAGRCSFAINGKSAFFGGLCLNAPLLIKIASKFGIHVYNYDNLAMHIGNDVICIHNREDAINTTIYLPKKYRVIEWTGLDDGVMHAGAVKENKCIGVTDRIQTDLSGYQTKLYFLE